MYKLEYVTNNKLAFTQVTGATAGITIGWILTRSLRGGLIGGILGLAIATIVASADERAELAKA